MTYPTPITNFYSDSMKGLARNLIFTPHLHRGVLRYAHKFVEQAPYDASHTSVGATGDTEIIFSWAAGDHALELDIEFLDNKYFYYAYFQSGETVQEVSGELSEENYGNVFSQVSEWLTLLTNHVNRVLSSKKPFSE